MPKPMDELEAASNIIRAKHEDPILILFRVRNNRVDYSIANRPEPNLSGITDAILMSGIIEAGKNFTFKRSKLLTSRERIERDDGRAVTYKESVEIDWHDKTIVSSKGKTTTLQVLSIVVQNLAASTVSDTAKIARQDSHGAN